MTRWLAARSHAHRAEGRKERGEWRDVSFTAGAAERPPYYPTRTSDDGDFGFGVVKLPMDGKVGASKESIRS